MHEAVCSSDGTANAPHLLDDEERTGLSTQRLDQLNGRFVHRLAAGQISYGQATAF